MIYIVYTVHVIVCIFLILVVLLQQGKGADLSVFGGGSTQTAFGAVGATSLLHKLTVTSFVMFILTTMTIAITQTGAGRSSVMSGIAEEAGPAAATPPLESTAAGATAPIPEAEVPAVVGEPEDSEPSAAAPDTEPPPEGESSP